MGTLGSPLQRTPPEGTALVPPWSGGTLRGIRALRGGPHRQRRGAFGSTIHRGSRGWNPRPDGASRRGTPGSPIHRGYRGRGPRQEGVGERLVPQFKGGSTAMRGLGTYLRQKRESMQAAAARRPRGEDWHEQVE